MMETRHDNEPLIKIVSSAETAAYIRSAQARGGKRPGLPKNIVFGVMEILKKPEPIKKSTQTKKKKV